MDVNFRFKYFAICLFVLLVSSVICTATSSCSASSVKPLPEDDKAFILLKHNEIRRAVPGGNLPDLVWNEYLAGKAQEWADTCNYWHYGTEWGENIAYDDDDGPKNRREALVSSLGMWMREKVFDKTGDLGCCATHSHGTSCCHYTQLLWKDTTSVGCGFSRCASMDNSIYTVCFYQPKRSHSPFFEEGYFSVVLNKALNFQRCGTAH